jgi:hypothetical protein
MPRNAQLAPLPPGHGTSTKSRTASAFVMIAGKHSLTLTTKASIAINIVKLPELLMVQLAELLETPTPGNLPMLGFFARARFARHGPRGGRRGDAHRVVAGVVSF